MTKRTAAEIRDEEHKTQGKLWGMADSAGLKPNPCLNRWTRWAGEQTVVDDPAGSFADFLSVESGRDYPDVMRL